MDEIEAAMMLQCTGYHFGIGVNSAERRNEWLDMLHVHIRNDVHVQVNASPMQRKKDLDSIRNAHVEDGRCVLGSGLLSYLSGQLFTKHQAANGAYLL
jgi:hypothetical protein